MYSTWHDRVPQGALARLERHAGKLARAVLRGLGGSNPARLPGVGETCRKVTRPDPTHSLHHHDARSGGIMARVRRAGTAPESPVAIGDTVAPSTPWRCVDAFDGTRRRE